MPAPQIRKFPKSFNGFNKLPRAKKLFATLNRHILSLLEKETKPEVESTEDVGSIKVQ
jgi:hypothetical protein